MSSGVALEAEGGRWKRYPAYRDSGVEWVGEVPEGWMIKRIGIDTKSLTGFAFESEQFSYDDEHIKLVRGDNVTTGKLRWGDKTRRWSEISNDLERYRLEENDIVIGMDGSKVGRNYAIVKEEDLPLILVQRVARIRCMQSLIPRFLYYFIANDMFSYYVNITKTDPAVPHITLKNIRDHPICFPPLPEQRTIAAFLDRETGRIDTLVAKKERQIELLQEKRAALISHAVTEGLDPDAPMKDSGVEWLGEVPEHWTFLPLKRNWQVTDCKHKTVSFIDEGVPVASIGEVQGIDVDLCNANMTTSEEYRELIDGGRKPKRGDIIYSRNATVGAAAFVNMDIDFCMGQDVCLISSKTNSQRFLVYQLRSPVVMNQLESLVVGATFKRINVAQIKNFLVACPSQKEQDAIAIHCDKVAHRNDIFITKVRESIAKLREYRTAIISAAVTGKIDVRAELVS